MTVTRYENWKGQKVDYIESTIDNKEYWFTPTEIINARARWIDKSSWCKKYLTGSKEKQ